MYYAEPGSFKDLKKKKKYLSKKKTKLFLT